MLTSARIEQLLKPAGVDWVSSLRAPQIAQLGVSVPRLNRPASNSAGRDRSG